MTQRYAHLHDDALRKASGVAITLFSAVRNAEADQGSSQEAEKNCILLSLSTFVVASALSATGADPLEVHTAGFGPEIQGLQLGKSMTWPGMINAQRNVNLSGFNLYVADNAEAVEQRNSSPGKPGKWLLITFSSTGNRLSGAMNINYFSLFNYTGYCSI